MKRIISRPALFVCLVALSAAGCAKKDFVKQDQMVPQQTASNQAATEPAKTNPGDDSLNSRQDKATETNIPSSDQLKATLDSIYFNLDSYELDSAARDTLAKTYDAMKRQPGIKARIEGNCDERGSSEYNLALGEKRAKAAQKYLSAMGVEASRLSTISYGKEKPVDPAHNEDAWKKNRRDDFVILSR